jgi:hypothetical protein
MLLSPQKFFGKEAVMGFLDVYPAILGYCQRVFRGCGDREELTAEAVAVAHLGWLAVQRTGKAVSPLSAAFYAIQRARSRRRTFSSNCTRDATRLRRRSVPADFFLDLAGDSDPVEEAILRVDFPAYLDTLPRRTDRCAMVIKLISSLKALEKCVFCGVFARNSLLKKLDHSAQRSVSGGHVPCSSTVSGRGRSREGTG